MMWEWFVDFITSVPLWELALIFFARIIEVSMGTLRVIVINKGYRTLGVVLAFFEVMLWVFVASRVITGIAEKPLKGIIYSFGFASGVYLGSKIESALALGKVLIQVITSKELGTTIASVLREQKLGVTTLDAHGKDADKVLLMIYTNRKGKESVISQIEAMDSKALIVSHDITTLQGGYINKVRGFVK